MAAIIRAEHLSHIYGQGMPDASVAIQDINLSIEEGDFVGLIGSTGSGKSTLINHFNGILKPTSGKLYVAGEDMWADPRQIRKFRFLVGLVFQYPEYQLFEETVEKDIAYGPSNMGLSEEEIRRRMTEYRDYIRSIPTVSGKPLVLPGEIEAACMRERLQNGIPLPESLYAELESLAKQYQLSVRL